MTQAWLGDVEHLERFEPFIDRDSADQLRDYFRLGGLARFEKSPMANMLANAEMFSANVGPCIYCGGVRNAENPGSEVGGSGFLGDTSKWTPAMIKRVRGAANATGKQDFLAAPGEPCPVCNGRGWVTRGRKQHGEITARPSLTASHGAEHSSDIDVEIGTCALCERILDKADVLFPLATSVLASCFGSQKYGTLGVWHLTPSGKTLLRRNERDKDPVLFFAGLRADNQEKKNKTMTAQLEAAEAQAKMAIDTAYRAWNAALFVDRCGV
jgi:hypothetical protein